MYLLRKQKVWMHNILVPYQLSDNQPNQTKYHLICINLIFFFSNTNFCTIKVVPLDITRKKNSISFLGQEITLLKFSYIQ